MANNRYSANNSKTEAIDGPRRHEQSLVAGIGAQCGRLQAELRYNGSNGFSPYSATKTGIRSGQLVVRYILR